MAGKFITFEGGEGAGKSTQAVLLERRLSQAGVRVVLTREPGGSPGAEVIRHVLLSGAARRFGPATEALLFAAARADHVDTVIAPALRAGRWVICDRFIDSTRVYQGTLGKVDMPFIRGLERIAAGAVRPDLTLVLDLPAQTGLVRARARRGDAVPDRFEGEDLAWHEALNAAFRRIAAEDAERCVVIDAGRPAEAVAGEVWAAVSRRLDPTAAPGIGATA